MALLPRCNETITVPAVFARECFGDLRALAPVAGAKQLLVCRPEAVAVMPCPAPAVDLDTPGDYQLVTVRWQE
jgi:CTP:molybdopterin cytidylyltransferase MocA